MLEIPLTNGGTTVVDDADADLVSTKRWRAQYRYRHGKRVGVASVVSGSASQGTLVLMHRLLTGADPDLIVDHADGNPLNNARANLRTCSHAQNMRNRAPNYNSQAGKKGVYVAREAGKAVKYRARIQVGLRRINLGRFDTPEAAEAAYVEASKRYHGEFSRAA